MIAFHFPPAAMGSGHLRTLGFVRHLPSFGWEPIVLSANAAAYPRAQAANNQLIPAGCEVHRALALDVRRHLAVDGKYFGFLAQPDGWASWWFAAVARGMLLIRRHRIDAIWSTYPIMTAHCIAHTLSRWTQRPWLADFRDPVKSSVEAENPFSVSAQQRCEKRVLARAQHIVFTTPGAMRGYAERYPAAFREGRLSVIPNGFEESAFADLPSAATPEPGRPLRLVHSGLLYHDGRNPVPFFEALAALKTSGVLRDGDVEIVLRACGSEARYAADLRRLDLERMVTLAPPVSNHDALREQAQADALLLFQGRKFDRQIPAKAYEYLRIGRPIFALVSESGDTATLLRETGAATMVAMDDADAVRGQFARFISELRDGRASTMDRTMVRRYSRFEGAATLAGLLDATEKRGRDKAQVAMG